MVMAFFFGAGMAMDAFVVAFRIPNLLRRLLAEGSLTIAFIPVFTETLTRRTRREAFELASVVLTLLILILTALTILGILLSPWIVRLQAWGFGSSGAKYELTVLLTRITFPYILFISIVAFFMGVLNSLRRFAAPAAAPIFLNVGIIGAAYLISPYLTEPIVGVACGVLIGGLLQVALQVPWAVREGMRFIPVWRPSHPAVKRIGALMLPAIFGSAVYQFNQYVITLLASFLPGGSVSWLYYADRLVQFPLGVFAIAVSTAALPSLSTQATRQETGAFGETLDHSLRLVFFVILPSSVGLIIVGEPIVRLFFERGAFGATSTLMTEKALFYYAVGLWAFAGIRVLLSAFYAFQDTKTPVVVAVVAVLIHLVLSLILAFRTPLGHAGLAFSLSLASCLQFFLLACLLNRKIPIRGILGSVLASVLKSMGAASVMGIGVYALKKAWIGPFMDTGLQAGALGLAALLLAGVVLYFGAARLLGCTEMAHMKALIPRRGRPKDAPRGSGRNPSEGPDPF
jgi:putative peptidoglycan lipid II flippase